jgi:hypothetical protein
LAAVVAVEDDIIVSIMADPPFSITKVKNKVKITN